MLAAVGILLLTRALAQESTCDARGDCAHAKKMGEDGLEFAEGRDKMGSTEFTEEMKRTWAQAEVSVDDKYLKIQGHPVMEAWEHPYMQRLAEITSSQGGNVLELGFGMAISATYMQKNKNSATKPLVSHHIIDANINQAARADKWAIETAKSQVVIHRGYSWDVAPSLRDGFFDGILYDTYPLEKNKVGTHHRDFIADAARLLKKGGVFTYFSNDVGKISDEDMKMLREAGFECTEEHVPTDTPADCQYWREKYLIAPTCIKK